MTKLWKFWFLMPAIIALWWESKPKDKRARTIKDIEDVFSYTGSACRKIWQKDKPEPQPMRGLRIGLADFDVSLVNELGVRCGITNSSELNIGKHGKVKPGTYKEVVIESPSMGALRYVPVSHYPDRKRWGFDLAGSPKTLRENDTLELAIDLDIGGVTLGRVHFKWDCK
jgi:hypothetical protein